MDDESRNLILGGFFGNEKGKVDGGATPSARPRRPLTPDTAPLTHRTHPHTRMKGMGGGFSLFCELFDENDFGGNFDLIFFFKQEKANVNSCANICCSSKIMERR